MKYFILSIICLCFNSISSQIQTQAQNPSVPTPGAKQSEVVILYGGTAHIGNGEVIEKSVVIFDDGKITTVADLKSIKFKLEEDKVVDITGKHIYPGLIAANTTMGLSEIGAVRATRDNAEVGELNPSVRSIISYNTDSRVIPTVRSNGILMAQVVPQGGTVSGQSSVVQLDAWNYEDAVVAMDNGIHLNWPNRVKFKGWWEGGGFEMSKTYDKQLSGIKDLFAEAKGYCAVRNESPNLKFEAMCGLFNGTKKLYVDVGYVREIFDAVNYFKEEGIEIVILGGSDIWMATDILKDNNIPVVLSKVNNLPNRTDEDIDMPFRLPKILNDEGILYCVSGGAGWDGFWDQRNLPFHLGTAIGYGLDKEDALKAVTSNAAKILGVDDKVGTIEVGKEATIIISKGDLFDMRSSHIEHAFIQGRKVDLDNKQKALYRKFMNKYGHPIQQH